MRSHQKAAAAHDLAVIGPDIEIPANHVDMGRRGPRRAGMGPIWIAEGHVNARNLFVLQNVPDHPRARQICADGELAHPIAVRVTVGVIPELILEIPVIGVGFYQAVAGDHQRERGMTANPRILRKDSRLRLHPLRKFRLLLAEW